MKHVLVTGGSRGIGAAAVRAFAETGYSVSFFYENKKHNNSVSFCHHLCCFTYSRFCF